MEVELIGIEIHIEIDNITLRLTLTTLQAGVDLMQV